MKKSELRAFIKEQIKSSLVSEATENDVKVQQDLNKELEATKGHRDDLGDSLSESLNPFVFEHHLHLLQIKFQLSHF